MVHSSNYCADPDVHHVHAACPFRSLFSLTLPVAHVQAYAGVRMPVPQCCEPGMCADAHLAASKR